MVFFGDGAMEEGVFYEALNIAKLWQLPMIFWMENNYPRSGRGAGHAALELTNIPKALDVEATVIDGIDVGTVHKTANDIVSRVRAGQGPLFVEARTHLWPGNAFNMPKLVGGITDIAWAGDRAARRKKCATGTKTTIRYLNYVRELAGAGVSRAEYGNDRCQRTANKRMRRLSSRSKARCRRAQ